MRSQNKLLSVIIPNSDDALTLKSVESLLEQVYTDIEILTVNFESTINDKRLRNIKVDSNDLLQNSITLIREAKGDYISFLVDGHTVSIDLYRNMISKSEKNNADIVFSNFVLEEKDERYIYNMMDIPFKTLSGEDIFKAFFKQEGLNKIWNIIDNKVYKKELVDKALKELNNVTFSSNDLLLLNYYLYKNAIKMEKINTDVVFIDSMEEHYSLEESISIFDIIQKDLDSSYEVNLDNWKRLYAQVMSEQGIKIESFYPNFKKVNNRDYYVLIKTLWDDGLEKIKKAIYSKSTELVSFDIFDTLVVRPFLEPIDLFDVIDKYFRKLSNNKTATEFKNMRVDSEALARKNKLKEKPNSEDVTLDDIYAVMKKRYRLGDEWLNKLKKLELEQELRFCTKRNTGFEIYEFSSFLGKKIVCTSDMYLDDKFLDKMLKNCGYKDISKIYVSSYFDKTKASGKLYGIVSEKEKVNYKNIVHIGDNYVSDYQNAKKLGIQAYQLRKPTELFFDKSKTGCLSAILTEHLPFWMDNSNGLFFNAIRVIIALVSNKYFDNPFKAFKENSDFNGDPYLIGYYALGSYMFGLTKWMLDDMQDQNYEKIVFMARDGYLPMECYKMLKPFYKKQPKEEYLYISRKALIPIIIQSKMDFYKLIETLNIEKNTPLDIAKYVVNLIDFDEKKFKKKCEENKLNPNSKLKTIEEFNTLMDVIIENFYNKEKHEKNLKILSDYFKNIFGTHSATFDIGYSARPSYFISNLLGEPVDTYFCNINHNQALRHASMGNFKLKTFFDGRPCTTGHAYELLVSAMAPSCVAYDIIDGKVVERFEKYSIGSIDEFSVSTMQNAAMDFVRDIAQIFGEDIDVLYFQNYYVGLPFMAYMNSSREVDKYPFNSVIFEDNLAIGEPTRMVRVWQDELKLRNQHTILALLNVSDNGIDNSFTGNRLVYNSNIDLQKQSKFKRLLFYILYDHETLKRRISEIKHHFWNR